MTLEATAKTKNLSQYPPDVNGNHNFLDVEGNKVGSKYDPNFPYAIDPRNFIDLNYSIFGENHK
jgi:hypothetical protein